MIISQTNALKERFFDNKKVKINKMCTNIDVVV